jgi:prophage regulatory protein
MAMPRLVRIDEVMAATGLSKSSIYARVKAGTFPPYVKIGLRGTRWVESSVAEWIESVAGQHCANGGLSS